MTAWRYANPVRLHFGAGEIDRLPELLAGRSYSLITHPDAALRPLVERVTRLVGQPADLLDGVEPNPSLTSLRVLGCRMSNAGRQPDVLVALGGGSAMDSAKFLAAGSGAFDPVLRYIEDGEALPGEPLPIIAIPTTAGTGSDLTKWATVWDPDHGRKLSLNHDRLYAEAAIVDPELTASLPWPATLASGLDALSHALESIWNIHSNPVTRNFAVTAGRDLMTGLERLQADLGDADARALTALGATRAGLAFSNTQTALAHNLSYPLTLAYGVPHGVACSFCLPEVMAGAIGADAACDVALTELFGTLAGAPARLRRFLDRLGVPNTPAALGIKADEWSQIVTDAFEGPRGRNFIGRADRFPLAAIAV